MILSFIYALYLPFFFVHPVHSAPSALGASMGYDEFTPLNAWILIYFPLLLFGDVALWIASVFFATGRYRKAFVLSILALAGGLLFSALYTMGGNLSFRGRQFGVILRPAAFALFFIAAFTADSLVRRPRKETSWFD